MEKKFTLSITAVASFVNKLFEARLNAHVLHLKTKSFAQHKALGEYYDQMNDHIDTFVEVYQGQYGLLSYKDTINIDDDVNPVNYFTNIADIIKSSHSLINEEDSHLDNIIDEMTAATYHLLYKLKYLK